MQQVMRIPISGLSSKTCCGLLDQRRVILFSAVSLSALCFACLWAHWHTLHGFKIANGSNALWMRNRPEWGPSKWSAWE